MNSKVVVGTGFSFDITDYFKFKKRKRLTPSLTQTYENVPIFSELAGSHFAWIVLLYSVCNAALIPAWVMNIEANKFLRICWRSLFQAFMTIPFVMY